MKRDSCYKSNAQIEWIWVDMIANPFVFNLVPGLMSN